MQMVLSNFKNPYSARSIKNVNIRLFGNSDCTGTVIKSFTVSHNLNFKSTSLLKDNVLLDTHSSQMAPRQEVGYSGEDNELIIKFTPMTQLDPTGRGKIQIKMPRWSNYPGDYGDFFTSPTRDKWCYTPKNQFNTTSQIWDSNIETLTIEYEGMQPKDIKDTVIDIRCQGFKNPIYKGIWDQFFITLFDGQFNAQLNPSIIEVSENIALDASSFVEHIMDSTEDFKVAPSNRTINTESDWSFTIALDFPLEKECTIVIEFPSDLTFNINQVRGQMSFKPFFSSETFAETDFIQDERSIKFYSCKLESFLSKPAG